MYEKVMAMHQRAHEEANAVRKQAAEQRRGQTAQKLKENTTLSHLRTGLPFLNLFCAEFLG